MGAWRSCWRAACYPYLAGGMTTASTRREPEGGLHEARRREAKRRVLSEAKFPGSGAGRSGKRSVGPERANTRQNPGGHERSASRDANLKRSEYDGGLPFKMMRSLALDNGQGGRSIQSRSPCGGSGG
jgi:hypothetical protein